MDGETTIESACPTEHTGLRQAAHRIGSPLKLLHKIRCLAEEYIDNIAAARDATYQEILDHSKPGDRPELEDCQDADGQDDAVPLGNQVPLGPGLVIPEDLKDSCKRKWLHLRRKEHRWRKLFSGFVQMKDKDKGLTDDNVTYDASKIPDVWDNLYYDAFTHRQFLGSESCRLAEDMLTHLHPLNEWVCLSEYGISVEEKL